MKRPVRPLLLFVALCFVPLIGLLIRHKYTNSLEYAVRSFLVALRDDDEAELKKWSTAQARQIMQTQSYYYFLGTGVSPRKSWDMWANGYLSRPGPLMRNGSFITAINNRNFHRLYAGGQELVFAQTDRGWKVVLIDSPDKRASPQSMLNASEKE